MRSIQLSYGRKNFQPNRERDYSVHPCTPPQWGHRILAYEISMFKFAPGKFVEPSLPSRLQYLSLISFGLGHLAQSKTGGERGIRTLDGLLTHTPLAGVRLRP